MILFSITGVIGIMTTILNGWVLSILWGWFFVPTLGLPDITIVQAIGIALVVGYLTYQDIDTMPEDKSWQEKLGEAMILSIIRSGIVLFFGWILHFFM
jgi:hypothetical protein